MDIDPNVLTVSTYQFRLFEVESRRASTENMIRNLIFSLAIVLLVFVVACNSPQLENSKTTPVLTAEISAVFPVNTTVTFENQLTNPVTGTPSMALVASSTPSPINNLPDGPPPTTVSGKVSPEVLCNQAAPGRPMIDVTVPDGSIIQAGKPFLKTWRLVNNGGCQWDTNYALVWFSGTNLGKYSEIPLSSIVDPGASIDLSVDLIAPDKPGVYQSNWKLRNAKGELFGIGPDGNAPFWVRIEVEELATPTISPEPSLAPTVIVISSGKVSLKLNQSLNLDTGVIDPPSGADISFLRDNTNSLLIMPLNGARMIKFGPEMPTQVQCESATLDYYSIRVEGLQNGLYFCYQTNQGLPGSLKITTNSLPQNELGLEFTTWAIP